MGEGRRERSSKRHRSNLGIGKSSSDTEVVRSNVKSHRKVKSKTKGKWHFIEGLSVDELARYRRRRVQNRPKDTLGTSEIVSETRGNLVTEYRRAFRANSEDSVLKIYSNKLPDTTDNTEVEKNAVRSVIVETESSLIPESREINDSFTMDTTIERSQNLETPIVSARPPLMRRGTSLKREGDEFYGNTEYSAYVPYKGRHRPDLARRPTSLKMEGHMDTRTEQCEKFVEWLNVTRPALARLPTNLRLEGDLDTTTENLQKYVPFVGARRPEILRQRAHLKLEGDSSFLPEYMDVFRAHNVTEKRTPVFPATHLQIGGSFYDATESSRINQLKDKNEIEEDQADVEELRNRKEREEEKRRKKEDDMKMLVSKLEELQGPPLEIPEYKDAYKGFPRERPKLMKPEDEIGRADGSKIHSSAQSTAKFQTKIDQDPEYNTVSLNMDRPVYRKPPLCSKPSGSATSFGFEGRANRESRMAEPTTEIRSQYVSYGNQPRVETLRMPANLRLEGDIDLQPEYREAYCGRGRGCNVGNEPRMHRRRDRSLSASRKRDNLWITNNNGEQFGTINASDEQDAFQVLNTRVHAENIVAKPPVECKRSSRLSHGPSPTLRRPTNLDIADSPFISRNRSPSPSYRLHVQRTNEEARGFPHQSPFSHKLSERHGDSSVNRLDNQRSNDDRQRCYSPSFGRIQSRKDVSNEQQAFVVLDNARNNNFPDNRAIEGRSRNAIDHNLNGTGIERLRPRNTTPTNWMPPWYDNTKTI